MAAHKTGVLARLGAQLTCVKLNLSQKEMDILSKLAEAMGVAFQIQDDLLNLEGDEYKKTKGYNGEDIHEVRHRPRRVR
jgi:geranylgeranyl diphosphate synthase type 3/geranylgeranyl diphosphate synthase type I